MIRIFKLNNKGLALVNVMVIGAAITAIALALSTLYRNSQKDIVYQYRKIEADRFTSLLYGILRSSNSCMNTLAQGTGTPANVNNFDDQNEILAQNWIYNGAGTDGHKVYPSWTSKTSEAEYYRHIQLGYGLIVDSYEVLGYYEVTTGTPIPIVHESGAISEQTDHDRGDALFRIRFRTKNNPNTFTRVIPLNIILEESLRTLYSCSAGPPITAHYADSKFKYAIDNNELCKRIGGTESLISPEGRCYLKYITLDATGTLPINTIQRLPDDFKDLDVTTCHKIIYPAALPNLVECETDEFITEINRGPPASGYWINCCKLKLKLIDFP